MYPSGSAVWSQWAPPLERSKLATFNPAGIYSLNGRARVNGYVMTNTHGSFLQSSHIQQAGVGLKIKIKMLFELADFILQEQPEDVSIDPLFLGHGIMADIP